MGSWCGGNNTRFITDNDTGAVFYGKTKRVVGRKVSEQIVEPAISARADGCFVVSISMGRCDTTQHAEPWKLRKIPDFLFWSSAWVGVDELEWQQCSGTDAGVYRRISSECGCECFIEPGLRHFLE